MKSNRFAIWMLILIVSLLNLLSIINIKEHNTMKQKFLLRITIALTWLVIILLSASICNRLTAQIRLPAELPNESKVIIDFSQAVGIYQQELQKPDVDFTLSPVERVTYNIKTASQRQQIDSWGRQLLLPDNLKDRIKKECSKYKVIAATSDTGIDEDHINYQADWFLPGQNFTGDNNPNLHFHGTHVNGIIVQLLEPLLELGTAKLLDLQTLNSSGSGNFGWGVNMGRYLIK